MNTAIHWKLITVASATLVVLAFLTTTISAVTVTEESECTGKFMETQPAPEQLQEVIKSHRKWINSKYTSNDVARKANLCEADLSGVILSGVDLNKATLVKANLSGAILNGSNLSGAKLFGANLSGANLFGANLSGANLREANLREANLSGADLGEARLSKADLSKADLSGAIFETIPGTIPNGTKWVGAKGLFSMKFQESQNALIELREVFRKAGQREQEREITYAIKRGEAEKSGSVSRWFSFVFFDLPSQYAMSPLRPLWILVGGIFLFAVPYTVVLRMKERHRRGAIWRVWNSDRLTNITTTSKSYLRIRPGGIKERVSFAGPINNGTSERERLSGFTLMNAFRIGLYFSLLSTFHFGWRDLNVGNWIARIQPRAYALRSTGWVRTVSGVQSLLSVYLLALWVLSYFGRPFE